MSNTETKTDAQAERNYMSGEQVNAWLNENLTGTQQADFIPVIQSFVDLLIDDLCNVYDLRLEQAENDPNLNVVFGIEAVFAERSLICSTTFGEFYLQEEQGKTLFGQSAYTDQYRDKAFALLRAFTKDFFNDFSSMHRTITHKDGQTESSRHHTVIEAMSSHIVDHSNSLQSLDKMVIKSDRTQKITFDFEKGEKYFHDRIKITATNLSEERKVLLQYLVDHINSADQHPLILLEHLITGEAVTVNS